MRSHGFNTQPPEGGWKLPWTLQSVIVGFNTQPPEGGWAKLVLPQMHHFMFQHTAA